MRPAHQLAAATLLGGGAGAFGGLTLHGAACHCCVFASETTCERSNRFLDRRFLVPLPGNDLAFFGTP